MMFFFQAEDGIRDLVRSRGLGDVYKRQPGDGGNQLLGGGRAGGGRVQFQQANGCPAHGDGPVSYTHLTLPTSDLV